MAAIAESLTRLDAGVSWTTIVSATDTRPGWIRCSDLLVDPARLVGWQRDAAAAYAGDDDPLAGNSGLLTGQGLVLDWYLAAVVLPAVAVFHLDRRVLDPSPERLWLFSAVPGSPVAATAVTSTDFSCLPDDPAAREPAARVVADLPALATLLRTHLVDHARRALQVYAPTTRIGRRGLWAAVTDAIDVAFLTGGWISQDIPRAASDAHLMLGHTPPLVGGSTLHQIVDERGRSHWTRRRYSCCYLYRVPRTAPCVTCPRVAEWERRRQATSW
jgi:ferric iron reductase protein FhuF